MAGIVLDRRAFVASAGAGLLALLTPREAEAIARADEVFASACRKPDGGYGLALFTMDGTIRRLVDLPERGHDVVQHREGGRVVVFARRPGTFALALDTTRETPPTVIAAAPGRHFYGHGAFSDDGRLLYATENDYDAARGVIGIYEVANGFARLGEIDSGGMGPHEVILLDDGRTLAIANGGIETHPDYGRTKLNLDTMAPSLVLADAATGDVRARFTLPDDLHQMSIRHLAVDRDGALWFGCQFQGSELELRQPVGRLRDGALDFVSLPERTARDLRNYIGSIAVDPTRGLVAVSSPVGNTAAVLDTRTGAVLDETSARAVCGLVGVDGGLMATTGYGLALPLDMPTEDWSQRFAVQWDHHVIRLA